MRLNQQAQSGAAFCAGLLVIMLPLLARGDVLLGTNGSRFRKGVAS